MSILRSIKVEDALVSNGTALLNLLTVRSNSDLRGLLDVHDDADFFKNVLVRGNSAVTGLATIGQTLDVTGKTTLNDDLHTVGAVDFDSTLTVAQFAAFQASVGISAVLNVGGPTTLQDSLDVQGQALFLKDVTVAGDLHVNGSMITKHQEEVFIGDSHLVLNSGATLQGSSDSGICSVYAVVNVLANNAEIVFEGDETKTGGVSATDTGFFRINGVTLDPLLVASLDKAIISVTGKSPYDGLYLFDGSDTTKPRLYSTANNVNWTQRMPFIKSPQWGPAVATNTAAHITLAQVQISHLMTDSRGLLSWCRGATSDDFWDTTLNQTLYVPFAMQGGITEYQTLLVSGQVTSTVAVLLGPGITATLSTTDKLGQSHKIFNDSAGTCTIQAPTNQTIDGYASYSMEDQTHIVVTKVAAGKYAII